MAIHERVPSVVLAALTAGLLYLVFSPFTARGVNDWYCSPEGTGTSCSFKKPCSMKTLMTDGMRGARPGDRFWARGGTYRTNDTTNRFIWNGLSCTKGQPCIFRNYNNEHVVIDCNYDLSTAGGNGQCWGTANAVGKYVTFWGFDFRNSSTQSRVSPNEAGNDPPTTMNEIFLSAKGAGLVNNFIRDQNNGLQMIDYCTDGGVRNTAQGQHTIYGNYFQYNGYWGVLRSYGHSMYLHNPKTNGETDRSHIKANVGLRAWHIGVQAYTSGGEISYMTFQDNVEAAAGHGSRPTVSWPAKGNRTNWYLGADGGAAAGCGHNKVLRGAVFDNNWDWGAGTMTIGASKGSCDVTLTNNRLLHTGGVITFGPRGANFPPTTITGNYFYGAPDGSGSPMPAFTQANYPNNTYAESIPSSGPDVFKYVANAYEAGRGWVAVWNPDSSATVNIDPEKMGCVPGEKVRIYNWQDNDPWDSTPIATQTGCAALDVSTTIAPASITQPGFTTDGAGTLFPKPPDLGPQFVVYFMYPDWAGAATPTPTPRPR